MTAPLHAASTSRPEPVLTRAGIVTALAVLVAAVIRLGGPDLGPWISSNTDWIASAVLAVGPLVSGLLARRHVTAVSNPVDNTGAQLVPAGSQAALEPVPELASSDGLAALLDPAASPVADTTPIVIPDSEVTA